MSEYLTNLGRRGELRRAALKLRVEAESHRESLRLALDPLAEVFMLPVDKILTLAAALAEVVTDLRETEAKIKKIGELVGD